MAKAPEFGEAAPDLALEGIEGTSRLSDHRRRRVVLLSHPGDGGFRAELIGQGGGMFMFFSNRLGCFPSLLLSVAVTVVLYLILSN